MSLDFDFQSTDSDIILY